MSEENHITGRYGTASRVTPAPETIAQQACLAVWFLHLPKVHPFWFHYVLGIIHLRPIAGAKDAKKDYPEAEYELMLYALDPKRPPRTSFAAGSAARTQSCAKKEKSTRCAWGLSREVEHETPAAALPQSPRLLPAPRLPVHSAVCDEAERGAALCARAAVGAIALVVKINKPKRKEHRNETHPDHRQLRRHPVPT